MPRYRYTALRVTCLDPRGFGPGEMREAVEYLKTIPAGPNIGLVAVTETGCRWPDGRVMFRLDAKPMLTLDEISGKTPTEVWELFDHDVDEQRKGLARRFLGNDPGSWEDYLKDF